MEQAAYKAMMEAQSSALTSSRPLGSIDDAEAISRAAHAGEADAMRLVAMLLARGIGCLPDWGAALAWQLAAAEAGDGEAQAELIVMSSDEAYISHLSDLAAEGAGYPSDAWRNLAKGVDLHRLVNPPVPVLMSERPVIAHIRGMVNRRFCTWLISRAAPRLERSVVVDKDAAEARIDQTRTNSGVAAPFQSTGLPLLALKERISRVIGMPLGNFETTNVLHYSPGETFEPHYDTFDPQSPFLNEDFKRMGQRTATLLVYLNDDFTGGETDFLRLDWRFRGKQGDALFWRNLLPEGGIDQGTLHAGRPPTSGEKWVLSQWIRDRPQSEFS